jgi:hypothetical protein
MSDGTAYGHRRAAAWFVGLCVLGSIALLIYPNRNITAANRALALAEAWVGFAPAVLYLARRDQPLLPFLPLVGFYYAAFFALPVFFFDPAQWRYGRGTDGNPAGLQLDHISLGAQVFALGGTAALIGGFLPARRLFRCLPIRFSLPAAPAPGRLRVLAWLLVAAGLVWSTVPVLHAIPSAGQFLQKAMVAGLGIMVFACWDGRTPGVEKAFVVLAVLAVLYGAYHAGLTTGAVLLAGYIAVLVYRRGLALRYIALTMAAVGATTAFVYPGLSAYRKVAWQGDGMAEAPVLPFGPALRRWTDNDVVGLAPLATVERRLSVGIATLSDVVRRTPGEVPYLGGVSYLPMLTGFVPRALWPGKPREIFGQTFGHRYRYLDPADRATSWNVPWLVEAYVNFGVAGVVLGMALIGAFLALFDRLFDDRDMTPPEFAVGASLLVPLAYQASNLSVMTSNLIPIALWLWLYFRLGLWLDFGRFRRSAGEPSPL